MDPVSLIVAALAAGAAAAGAGAAASITDTTKDAVAGLYERLKTAITKKGNPHDGTVRMWERYAADPAGYEAPIRDLVLNSEADRDPELVVLAQQLLTAADPNGANAGSYSVHMQATANDSSRVYQAGRDQQINEK